VTTVGILGASGFAREVGDIALELGRDVVYIARDEAERDHWTFPGNVIVEADIEPRDGLEFAIGIGENGVR